MTNFQQLINTFMLRADQELPGSPVIPSDDVCRLRLRLIAEELMELADSMGCRIRIDNYGQRSLDGKPGKGCHVWEVVREATWPQNLVEIADGFSDINYVSVGGQSACGIDGEPSDLEVHASNMSKFIDGHRDEGGKWIKGPSTRAPDIASILRAQGADC